MSNLADGSWAEQNLRLRRMRDEMDNFKRLENLSRTVFFDRETGRLERHPSLALSERMVPRDWPVV